MADMSNGVVINGGGGAWLYPAASGVFNGLAATPDATDRFIFDNIRDASCTIVRPESASAGEEFVEVTRGDGAIIQYPKITLRLDGVTGALKSGGASASASKGLISFVANGADKDSADWLTYIQKLNEFIGAEFLIAIPLGFSYDNWIDRNAGSPTDVEAIALCLGNLDADIAHAASAFTPAAHTITVRSKASTIASSALSTKTLPDIVIPEGGTHASPTGYTINGITISAPQAADLVAGKLVIVAPGS
jgi:hypothetical protein